MKKGRTYKQKLLGERAGSYCSIDDIAARAGKARGWAYKVVHQYLDEHPEECISIQEGPRQYVYLPESAAQRIEGIFSTGVKRNMKYTRLGDEADGFYSCGEISDLTGMKLGTVQMRIRRMEKACPGSVRKFAWGKNKIRFLRKEYLGTLEDPQAIERCHALASAGYDPEAFVSVQETGSFYKDVQGAVRSYLRTFPDNILLLEPGSKKGRTSVFIRKEHADHFRKYRDAGQVEKEIMRAGLDPGKVLTVPDMCKRTGRSPPFIRNFMEKARQAFSGKISEVPSAGKKLLVLDSHFAENVLRIDSIPGAGNPSQAHMKENSAAEYFDLVINLHMMGKGEEMLDMDDKLLSAYYTYGIDDARKMLIEKYRGMVWHVARKLKRRIPWTDLDTMIDDGILALVRSPRYYSPWIGTKFSTYAYGAIRKTILQGLDRQKRRFRERLVPFGAAYEGERNHLEPGSWDPREDIERALDTPQLVVKMREALERLPDIQRDVLERNFLEGETLEQIGKDWDLSRAMMSLHGKKALEKLRHLMQGMY